jgi:hypothetical protein
VRITAKADSEVEVEKLIRPIEEVIRQRLGDWVYGADLETLEETALRNLLNKEWNLVVVEAGLGGNLIRRLATSRGPFLGGEVLVETPTPEELFTLTEAYRQRRAADVGLGVVIHPAGERQDVHLVLLTPQGKQQFFHPYGGAPENAPRWALNQSLDLIRNL